MLRRIAVLILCLMALPALAMGEALSIYDETVIMENHRIRAYLAGMSCFWSQETLDLNRDELLAVYAYPSEEGWRGAKGKAAVSLRAPFTVLASTERAGQTWLLIDYETSGGAHRVGYIRKPEGVQAPVCTLDDTSPAVLSLAADTPVTDDPNGRREPIARLRRGDAVTVLGYTNDYWAYVELPVDGKPARGFLPLEALQMPEETLCPEVMAQLAGTWRFIGGGELLGYGAVFDGTGQVWICDTDNIVDFPPPSLVVRAESLPSAYRVYRNERGDARYPGCSWVLEVEAQEGGVSRYGLSLAPAEDGEPDVFGLFQGEAGGGYERADGIPVTYEE